MFFHVVARKMTSLLNHQLPNEPKNHKITGTLVKTTVAPS